MRHGSLFWFLTVFLFLLHAKAETSLLAVVDVDDTLKETHVHNLADALQSIRRADQPFSDMAPLLNGLAENGARIVYVSIAPRSPMLYWHRLFLQKNGFPEGDLYLPGWGDRENFKLRSIRTLLSFAQPKRVLFIGDDGEEDPAVYDDLAKEFPDTHALTYIRRNYAGRTALLPAGQLPFVTAGEIALDLFRNGIMSDIQARSVLGASLIPRSPPPDSNGRIVSRQGLNLPNWTDCQGHHPDLSPFWLLDPSAFILEQSIWARCR